MNEASPSALTSSIKIQRMKTYSLKTKAIFALTVSAMLSISSQSSAATLTWDANGATALQTDGAGGGWLTANQWWNGLANVNWTSGDDAIFGNGGAGGAVTLAGGTTVNSLTFNSFTGTYTLGTVGPHQTKQQRSKFPFHLKKQIPGNNN
jgi:hypothetical protein